MEVAYCGCGGLADGGLRRVGGEGGEVKEGGVEGKEAKQEGSFVKACVAGNVNTVRGYVKTFIAFMVKRVAKKNTWK